MPIIRYGEPLRILVSVKGHPFDRNAFAAIFETMEGVQASFVDQPAASKLMNPDAMTGFDALVLYDMPGLDFRADSARPVYVDPEPQLKAGFEALLKSGKGVVALHHAIAGWPTWPAYGDWLGGRFLYKPAVVRGEARQDSGYCHDVSYEAEAVDPGHPVLGGVPSTFPMKDELYLYEVFEDEVRPLLRAQHTFTRDAFYSAYQAVAESRLYSNDGWTHAPGSNLIGWTKRAINSPLVYFQFGDGADAYDNPDVRRLISNAISWVSSPAARSATDRPL